MNQTTGPPESRPFRPNRLSSLEMETFNILSSFCHLSALSFPTPRSPRSQSGDNGDGCACARAFHSDAQPSRISAWNARVTTFATVVVAAAPR